MLPKVLNIKTEFCIGSADQVIFSFYFFLQYGLYSAFMGCFVYCFLGTAKDITLGPTAIMSLMTATFATSPIEEDATYAIVLCLITGCVQLLLGLLNLGTIL